MIFDPMSLVAFFHVLLFVYWLGGDLGVMLTSMAQNKPGASEDAKARLRDVWMLIDMAPRTCLVLMVPVGLTLAQRFGSPITGAPLIAVWIASLAWLWLVWQVFLKEHTELGKLFWKIDFVIRTLVMLAFVLGGAYSFVALAPFADQWLSLKIFLFGITILLGLMIRIILIQMLKPKFDAAGNPIPFKHWGFWSPIRLVVFGIWLLTAVIAFLGLAKPIFGAG